MNDDTFFHEVQDLYQRIVSADTDDFIELSKIANIDPKIYLKKVNLQGVNSNQTELNLGNLREETTLKVQGIDAIKIQNRRSENRSSLSFSQPNFGFRKSNFFVKFLWFCSGANIKVLEKCPVDQGKYTTIGFTILLTSVLASLSGGYAIFTIFNSIPIAAGFGSFWGLMIGNLDRSLISTSSFRKEKGLSISILKSIPKMFAFCIRLLGAVAIAFVVAKPLQIKIFEQPIQKAFEKKQLEFEKKSNANNLNIKMTNDLITQIRIMAELEKSDSIYAYVNYLILFIFVWVGTAPVLAKLFLNSPVYDKMLELEEKLESEISLNSLELEREFLLSKNREIRQILQLKAEMKSRIEEEALVSIYKSDQYQQSVRDLSQVYISKIRQEISHLGKEDETIENLSIS